MAEERRDDTAIVSDESLMMSVQNGQLASLQELMLRYQRGLYGFLVRLTGDEHLAEDVFQDCFLKIVQGRSSFDPSRGFRPWLYAVAANLARDACRRREVRAREENLERIAPARPGPAGPDIQAERNEEMEMLVRLLGALPEDARTMVLLHFQQGLSYREVAESMRVAIGTVKSRIHWAVAKVVKELNERSVASGAGR